MWVIHNNEIILESELAISSYNRAFQYADGFFETIGLKNGSVRFIEDHISRMKRGAKVFSYHLPEELSQKELLLNRLNDLLTKNNLATDAIIKIIIWRKGGGKYVPEGNDIEYLLRVEPKQWNNEAVLLNKVMLFDQFINIYSRISSIKTIASTNYVLAGVYKKDHQADDLILLGEDRSISECLYSNIFWFENETLYTPSYLTGCIDGIMRKQILKSCIENDIPFQEGVFNLDDLMKADFVFNCNISGFSIIRELKEKIFEQESQLFEMLIKNLK